MAVEKQKSEGTATEPPPLPKGYTPMLDILDGKVSNSLNNVGGLVRSCLLPRQVRGGDYKMTLELIDKSLEPSTSVLKIHIFRSSEEDMPVVCSSDVVLVRQAKVQNWEGGISLLSNRVSKFYVYSATKIPPASTPAQEALDRSLRDAQKSPPTEEEHRFASWLFHNVSHGSILDSGTFEVQAKQSLKVRDKFRLLKDVKCEDYCNMIVRVEHKPYAMNEVVVIWVSDYSSNTRFQDFHEQSGGASTSATRVGDSYDYMTNYGAKSTNKQLSDWKGPRGKMSIQVSCFGQNARYIADYVQMGDWLELRNVCIKWGRNQAYLEGVLYEDRERGNPLHVSHVDLNNPENIDPRYKDALRRMRDYQRQTKKPPMKRQAPDPPVKGGKKKKKGASAELRQQKRAEKSKEHVQKTAGDGHGDSDGRGNEDGGAAAAEKPSAAVALASNVNDNIVSEYQDQPVTPLADVLAPVYWQKPAMDADLAAERNLSLERLPDKIRLPFVNLNFRAQVRVVDFLPSRLEDFAVARKQSELDILSDNESDDLDSSDDSSVEGGDETGLVWEWRFALLLEEATPLPNPQTVSTPARLWAVVDNTEAQMLTGLTACSLRTHPQELDALREMLFVLWGDLEEKKREQLRAQREAVVAATAAATATQKAAAHKASRGLAPPADSSDDEWQQQPKAQTVANKSRNDAASSNLQVSNRPFVCCMRQYGVRKRAAKTNGDGSGGKTWKRTFGLFGTKIRSIPPVEEGIPSVEKGSEDEDEEET